MRKKLHERAGFGLLKEGELHSTRQATRVALLVAGAFFMENLDGTVIATALPQMAVSFGAHPVDLNLGMTVYMLTLAVFIPVSGWVADRLGARTVFSTAIGIFTLASMICGISNTLAEFTAARVKQFQLAHQFHHRCAGWQQEHGAEHVQLADFG